jgi:hypothetical protein
MPKSQAEWIKIAISAAILLLQFFSGRISSTTATDQQTVTDTE